MEEEVGLPLAPVGVGWDFGPEGGVEIGGERWRSGGVGEFEVAEGG